MNTIRTYIDQRAESRPEEPFLIAPDAGRELHGGKLRDEANKIGNRLAGLGIAKGEKVAFLLDNGYWTTILFLGTMYSGRVIVPLNAVAGLEQLGYILAHSDTKVLFISDNYLAKLKPVLETLPNRILVIRASEDREPEWSDEVREGGDNATLPTVSEEDDALLIYTSGTTGRPKGVMLTHSNIIAGGLNTAGAHQLREQDRALCVLPLYHINGEMVTVIAPLVSNSSIVMPHRFSASVFWELMSTYRCTWFSVVPTIIAYLLDHAERENLSIKDTEDVAQVRFGRSASSALPPQMHRDFEKRFGIPLIETMGLTETAAQILSNPMPPSPIKYGSPGLAYGNEAKIVDESGHEAACGDIGELLIRGSNVMKAYYKDPDATKAVLEADGWFHTGDLGYRDEEGYFFITGRLKELIIKGGENIAPREIDEVLYKHPAVLEAAAFGVPDENYGEEVMACVALKPDAKCLEKELVEFCLGKLGKYKAPKHIRFMDSLPKGPSGKIQRLKLAAGYAAESDSSVSAK